MSDYERAAGGYHHSTTQAEKRLAADLARQTGGGEYGADPCAEVEANLAEMAAEDRQQARDESRERAVALLREANDLAVAEADEFEQELLAAMIAPIADDSVGPPLVVRSSDPQSLEVISGTITVDGVEHDIPPGAGVLIVPIGIDFEDE